MEQKKSIVSYADDEDEDQSLQSSSKECDNSHSSSARHSHSRHSKRSSKSDLERTERATRDERKNEPKRSERHSSHNRHHSSRGHHRDRSRSPSYRMRNRSRSRSCSRDSHRRSRHSSSKHRRSSSPKHKSRSCRKSKRDRSKSRESKNYHRQYRSPSTTPDNCVAKNIVQLDSSKKPVHDSAIDLNEKTANKAAKTEPKGTSSIAGTSLPSGLSIMAGQMSSSIPHFYNANAVNPLKIASKEEKRKLLWGDTKDKPSNSSTSVWTNLKFSGDHGSEVTEKFRKLMGIKSTDEEGSTTHAKDSDISISQEKLFQNLDMQYSMARMSTHTHRGVGLGFSNNRKVFD